MTDSNDSLWNRLLPLLLFCGVLLLYSATLAPTVLWGDDAFFQRAAFDDSLRRDGGYHWLWLQAARLFLRISSVNVAYTVNFVSAAAAALTVSILYGAIYQACRTRPAAVVGAVGIALSHTFWMHAVRAEVYTVFTVFMALQLFLWFAWRVDRLWPILLAAALGGITLLGHQMALLMVPALLLLLVLRRRWLTRREWGLLLLSFVLGLLPFFLVVWLQIDGDSIGNKIWHYLTHSGIDFSDSLFDFATNRLARNAAIWIGLLGLQFVGFSGLLGLWGALFPTNRSHEWWTITTLFVTSVLFAFSYSVSDQFVFFLPSYIAFAFFVAWGWQRADRFMRGRRLQSAMLLLIVLIPIGTYYALPRWLVSTGSNPLGVRILPNREPNRFFLWPAKGSYTGAYDFGRSALEILPADSILLADYTPYETLLYLKTIESIRPDVRLVNVLPGRDLKPTLDQLPKDVPIFFADNDPEYYNFKSMSCAKFEPHGPIYRFVCAEY